MPGMFSIRVCPADGEGDGVGDLAGIPIRRMCMLLMPCLFGVRRALCLRRALDLTFDLTLRLDFRLAFGFRMFMPGMSCMLCPCCCAQAPTAPSVTSAEISISAHRRARIRFQLLMITPENLPRRRT